MLEKLRAAELFKASGSIDPIPPFGDGRAIVVRDFRGPWSSSADEPAGAIPRQGCFPAEPASVSHRQRHCNSVKPPGDAAAAVAVEPQIQLAVAGGVDLVPIRPASRSSGVTNPIALCKRTVL